MKPNIHPTRYQVLAQCVCANQFYFYSALDNKVVHIEVCNKCHPFYTKKQQVISATGRVEHFQSKFSTFQDKKRQAAAGAVASSSNKAAKPTKVVKVSKTLKPIKANKVTIGTSKAPKVEKSKKSNSEQ